MASSMNLSTLVVVNAIQTLTVEETKDLVFQLGVPLSDLDDVTARYGGSDCKRHLIQKWLDGDTWASWAELVSGLERIKRNVLAKNIESAYIAAVPTKTNAYLSATTPFPKATIPKSSDPVALTPASIQPFSPGVKTIQLPAVNIGTRVAEVEANLKHFEDEFSDLMCYTQASLCNRESQDKHFLDRFRGYLLVLPVSKKAVHVRFFDRNEDDIIEAKTTLKLFAILCRYCNYSNYEIILHVVTKFCEATLKQRMLYYQDSLIRFEMDTTVDVYLYAIKVRPEGEICKGFTQMAMKINKPTSMCTLYEIRMLRESTAENASVHSYCVYIEESIAQRSVLVSLRIHPAVVEDVTSAISSDFMNVHHLTELSVNGRVVLKLGPIPTPQSPREHISEPLLTTLPPPLPPKNTTTVVDDQTGDSGMGTGSGSAEYVLNEWRQAMTRPPPDTVAISPAQSPFPEVTSSRGVHEQRDSYEEPTCSLSSVDVQHEQLCCTTDYAIPSLSSINSKNAATTSKALRNIIPKDDLVSQETVCIKQESRTNFDSVAYNPVILNSGADFKEHEPRLADQARACPVETMIALSEVTLDIEKEVDRKQIVCLHEHEKKIEYLNDKLCQLKSKKKYITLDEHERISKEREVLNLKVTECQQQKREFEDFVQLRLSMLSSLSAESEVCLLEKQLSREYTRFSKALPIYARRSEIIQTVCDNNVTVLVGETGSGKSTQVVQYLYEAGIASQKGLIVSTQPRKVAAITLAKYVSLEMQVELGQEVGYRVGMGQKFGSNTKILYMTDHTLLNECIADHTLSKYSYVLIDEAHERSINTDILLSVLKQCLPFRPDLKLVIMSATIEPELFVKYFEGASARVATIMVSGRTFPVDVEYDPLHSTLPLSPESNYVMNTVEIAKKIHINDPPGDILVFLTCTPEIERACRALHDLQGVIALPLHGKLPPDEQQKIFEDYGEARKIIFSTNVAETSVTIPGVVYVVDTGLAKEMHFDSRKNVDSLEVRMISKSSAEQRKGRAGRVSAGKCYRLYSSEDYASKMPNRTKPEILRIQLSQVVLKLLEFGVPNVLTFDFVEPPDHDALEAAVETLRLVGAIQDISLTDIGKKMACLPIMPELAKVLLDGVNIGLGTEALVSVALSSLAGQVFFRGGTDEMKEESDKLKLSFCHTMGDQMTNLSVYQCWHEQKKEDRTKWCLENCVNAKSMRVVQETVMELRHILKKCLNIDVPLQLSSLEGADCYLGKLYFDAFLTNLAVYLGHEQAGYLTTNKSRDSFLIFPGSSLRQLSSTPKYVIYEKTLKTSRQFLTQIMCVRQEWVDEAVKMGKLSEDPAKIFSELMFTPIHAIAVGPQIYKDISMRRKELFEMLVANTPPSVASPVIDFSIAPKQWGIVHAVGQKQHYSAVKLLITQVVGEKQAEFEEQTKEFGITKEHDTTRVVIGAGGTVQQVIMPFQFRTVIAVGSKKEEDVVKCQLRKYGNVKEMTVMRHPNELRIYITYSSNTAAQQALAEFHHPNVMLRPQNSQQFTLKLQWERRQRGQFAFLSFDSYLDCRDAFSSIHYTLSGIKVSPERSGLDKLFLSGRELSVCNEEDLKEKIRHNCSRDIAFSLKMGYNKFSEKQDLLRAAEDTEKKITDLVAQYVEPGTYSVKYETPHPQAVFYRAYVTFYDPDNGYKVLSDFKQEYIDGKLLTVIPNLTGMLVFRREIYILILNSLESTQRSLLQRYKDLRIKINPPDNKDRVFAQIKINANDVKTYSIAYNTLHQAAKPLILNCNTTELQEYVLGRTHREDFKTIQAATSTYLWRDLNTMSIKVYGNKENQQTAVAMIGNKALEFFSGGAMVTEVSLREIETPGLMKCLVSRYNYDLSGMLEFEGVRRITLNPRLQLITLLATAKGQESVIACIKDLSKPSRLATIRKSNAEYDVECSACFTPVDESKDLIRLECCGHAFHIECIEMQMKSDTLVFPVQCSSEGCSKKFVLKDFENLQKRLKFRMADLVSASLQNFMEKNSDKYRNCPTPECKMIYEKNDEAIEFICRSCGLSTCTKCHEQYHAGISCEDCKKSSEELMHEWMEKDPKNRKKCPKCSCPIEKNKGCMHMACPCGAHICWQCMKYFKSQTECYSHMEFCWQ